MAGAHPHKPDLLKRYLELDQGGKVQAECKSHLLLTLSSARSLDLQTDILLSDVWIDGDGGLRCKTTVSLPASFAPNRNGSLGFISGTWLTVSCLVASLRGYLFSGHSTSSHRPSLRRSRTLTAYASGTSMGLQRIRHLATIPMSTFAQPPSSGIPSVVAITSSCLPKPTTTTALPTGLTTVITPRR